MIAWWNHVLNLDFFRLSPSLWIKTRLRRGRGEGQVAKFECLVTKCNGHHVRQCLNRQGSEPSVRVSSLSWFEMGSSKKHKEKDKDRDREKRRERERKHRERDSNKDRDKDSDKERRRREERAKEKRSHPAEDDKRVEKKKVKREDYDDLYEYAVEESTRDDHGNGMVNLDWNACSMFKMLLVRNIDLWLVTKLFLSVFSNVLIR